MMDHELKESLSECLDGLETALDVLDYVKEEDYEINSWYDEIKDLYERIRFKFEK